MEFWYDIKCAFLPEFIITCFIFINIFLSLFFNKRFYKTSQWIAIMGVLMAFASIGFIQAEPTYHAFSNAMINNVYTVFFKSLILVGSFFEILISHRIVKRKRSRAFEHFAILFCAILGAMFLVSSNDFITAFLSFSMLSISVCLLLGLLKSYLAKEGAFKYFIGSIIASSLFLLGSSYIYGITGVLNFDNLSIALQGYEGSMLFALGAVLVIFGLIVHVAALPFVCFVADMYKGVSYPIGMFVSTVPLIAGYALLSRILFVVSNYVPMLGLIIILMAFLTIASGVYCALRQNDMRRFLGCNTAIQSGFIMIVMGVFSPYSLAGMLYYLICYLFMNIAVWAGANMFYNLTKRNEIEAYMGIAYNKPFYTTAMIFVVLALAGLPPTSGFLARFFVFSAISRLGFMFIVFLLLALLLSVVALCLYFRLIKIMFEKNTDVMPLASKFVFSKFAFYFCAGITVIMCMFSSKIIEFCEIIAYSL